MKEGTRRLVGAAFILAVIAALAIFWFSYREDLLLKVSILDIGQGDAILIQTPHGEKILIDGGPNARVLRRLGEELPFWDKTIDLVILTHPHEDHFAGLKDVMERYRVKRLLLTDAESKNLSFQEFLQIARDRQIEISFVDSPQDFSIDGVSLHILYPFKSLKGLKINNHNNGSIIARVSYREMDFLFTGDAEEPAEQELLAGSPHELKSEFLKLGHHGSDTSSSEAFLRAVEPTIAVASAGIGNSYGHPSLRVLERLRRLGISSYRTDLEGTIKFSSDGHRLFKAETCLIGC